MTTSGQTCWTPDVSEYIEEAFERAGIEVRNGYQFRTARRSLNILMAEWANKGINLWTVEQGAIPLKYGKAEYELPADTVDLLEHVIRQNPGSPTNQTDIVISRVSLPTYAAIPNKLATGRPIQIYIDRQAEAPNFKLWPTPNATGSYTLVYCRLRRMQNAGDCGTNTMDVPFRFVPALIAGLAYYVALKQPEAVDRIPMLKQMYEEAFFQASLEDREKAPVRFVPKIGSIGSGGW
jgi:hypothetical protein